MVKSPNILVTGTPGTGKTCTCALIAEKTGLKHVQVGDIVKEEQCHDGMDEDFDSLILNEEKLVDALQPIIEEGGKVVDFHGCDLFPKGWFDLVLVLRADNATLFDRLEARGYSERKRTENLECEIMQVVLEEAREHFPEEIIQELPSNTVEEMDGNVGRIAQWLEAWKANNR